MHGCTLPSLYCGAKIPGLHRSKRVRNNASCIRLLALHINNMLHLCRPIDPIADHFLLIANTVDGDDSQGAGAEKVPVGTVRMHINDEEGVAILSRLAVLSDARGCSYGKILVQAVIECAKTRGVQALTLSAQHFKVDFYKHLGFHIDNEEVFYRYDVAHYHMRLPLEP